MKVLFLNCYDPKNPKSGGAEKFTMNQAKRLVVKGYEVIWISSSFKNSLKKETIDGVEIRRFGNRITVLLFAFFYYLRRRTSIDLVVDQFHAYPFFSCFYVSRRKLFLIIHEVAGEIWNYETIFPLSIIGRVIEKITLKIFYKSCRFITVSRSTKDDLTKLGIDPQNISIIPQGVDQIVNSLDAIQKNDYQLVATGGVRRMKRVEHQIETIKLLKSEFPTIKLYITGRVKGKYYRKLLDLVKKYNLSDNILFTDFIDDDQKNELVKRSYLVIGTSIKEGWGLTVTESASFGTPAVCYNVAGYKDSVAHFKTGLLAIENTPQGLTLAIKRLFLDKKLYNRLQEEAFRSTKELTWDKSFKVFEAVLKQKVKDPVYRISLLY